MEMKCVQHDRLNEAEKKTLWLNGCVAVWAPPSWPQIYYKNSMNTKQNRGKKNQI